MSDSKDYVILIKASDTPKLNGEQLNLVIGCIRNLTEAQKTVVERECKAYIYMLAGQKSSYYQNYSNTQKWNDNCLLLFDQISICKARLEAHLKSSIPTLIIDPRPVYLNVQGQWNHPLFNEFNLGEIFFEEI